MFNYNLQLIQAFIKAQPTNVIISKTSYYEMFLKNQTTKQKIIPYGLKDNCSLKNEISTAGSKFLINFHPTENCTIVNRLLKHNYYPIFKSNQDELSMGGTGLESYFGIVANPFDEKRITGGSSSGSAYLVAKDIVPFAFGTDTGDSVRKPAAWLGIIGFKPTWGLISRYGIFDFAPSWDTIGWFAKSISEIAKIFDIIQGYDENDASTIDLPPKQYFKNLVTKRKKIKLVVIKNLLKQIHQQEISEAFDELLIKMRNDGYEIIEINLNINILNQILFVYKTISSIEAFSTNANLSSFLFGNTDNLTEDSFDKRLIESRGKNLKLEVKKRFLIAQNIIQNHQEFYLNASKIRRLIINELKIAFSHGDAIIMPAVASFPGPINATIRHQDVDSEKYNLAMENYLTLFNANGCPSISLPLKNNLAKHQPISINLATDVFKDLECLQIAEQIMKEYCE